MKNIITYLIILLPWFLGGLIVPMNRDFYLTLNKPFFAPPGIIFAIVWSILYILISISIYKIVKNYKKDTPKEYLWILAINYVLNQLFPFFFFHLRSTFLGFVSSLSVLISSLFLFDNTKTLQVSSSKYLKPYIIWNIFAVILSLTIYFMNL